MTPSCWHPHIRREHATADFVCGSCGARSPFGSGDWIRLPDDPDASVFLGDDTDGSRIWGIVWRGECPRDPHAVARSLLGPRERADVVAFLRAESQRIGGEHYGPLQFVATEIELGAHIPESHR